MHRTDAAGATAGNLFTNGNPGTGTPATVVDDAWLNDMQENVAQAIEAAGIVLVKGTYTQLRDAINSLIQTAANVPNSLLNSDFYFAQRLGDLGSVAIANGIASYGPDRWYGKNSLGTNGVLTLAQIAGTLDGSHRAAQLKITTAPTAAQANGCELYCTLENADSLAYYNKLGSFSAQVKALGNVTQVGVQFFSKTTEAKVDTAIGAEVLVTVSTGAFALAKIVGQAMGTAWTSAGVVGIRIRTTAVSSGNLYDLNNGFIVEQTVMNPGPVPAAYRRQSASIASELQALQRYFWKTFPIATAPAQNAGMTGALSIIDQVALGTTGNSFAVTLPTRMRVIPSQTSYNPAAANAQVRDANSNSDCSSTLFNNVSDGFFAITYISSASGGPDHIVRVHVALDAEI